MATPPKLQSSYSANDIPTVKNTSGSSMAAANANNHAQQHFHHHNASIGRIPAGIAPTRGHSRELSSESNANSSREQANSYQSLQSVLQASAPPFGPSTTTAAPQMPAAVSSVNDSAALNGSYGYYPTANHYAPNHGYAPTNGTSAVNGFAPPANGYAPTNAYVPNSGYTPANGANASANGYNPDGCPPNGYPSNGYPPADGVNAPANYSMSTLNSGMQQMSMGNANNNGMYPSQNYNNGHGVASFNQGAQPRDSQARVMQHRRQIDNEGASSKRFLM